MEQDKIEGKNSWYMIQEKVMDINANTFNENRFEEMEKKLTEIRKLLFGTVLLTKEIWKAKREQKEEGTEILKDIEEAEEAFVDNSLTDRFERMENIIHVIHKRAKALFLLLEDVRKNQQNAE
jgi:hypothetical protein